MIVTRTPYRISLCGGGSDYKSFYSRHGGACLTATIDKYCHVLLRKMPPFLGSKYRIFWSKSEAVDHIEDIEHRGVQGCLRYFAVHGMDEGLEINHAGDLPARSGLGSSSAFVVGLMHALRVLRGEPTGRGPLARDAIFVEQEILKETVGVQDQIQCAWGGINQIIIERDGKYAVRPLELTPQRIQMFEESFMLVFTGLQRYASEIAAVQVDNVERKEKELLEIKAMVPWAAELMRVGKPSELGRLLHDAWLLKRSLTDKVSSPELDQMYETAREAGAWGGKVLGAGGGGFFLFCAPPKTHARIAEKLGRISIPVKFEHGGSQLVLNA